MNTEQVVAPREIKPIPPPAAQASEPVSDAVPTQEPIMYKACPCPCGCGKQIVVGCGFHPGLRLLSHMSRGEKPNPMHPFTETAILESEVCQSCAKTLTSDGDEIVSTTAMLCKMAELAERNARRIVQRMDSQAAWEEREKKRRLDAALARPDDRGVVNKSFAEAKPRREQHKHGKRTAATRRFTPKPKPSTKNEGKKGKEKNKNKGR